MNGFLTFLVLFLLLAIIVIGVLDSLGTINDAQLGSCNRNSTGSWQNCSLSNADADQIERSAKITSNIFGTLGTLQWLVIAGIFITVIALFRKRR